MISMHIALLMAFNDTKSTWLHYSRGLRCGHKQTHQNKHILMYRFVGYIKKYRSIDLNGCSQSKLILNMWIVATMV